MWRSLHAAATYSGTKKNSYSKRNKEQLFGNSYSKRKQGAVVQKTVIQKENKGQLLGKQFFKKEGTVARKTVFKMKTIHSCSKRKQGRVAVNRVVQKENLFSLPT